MLGNKVCMLSGTVGAKEFALLEKYAVQGCTIAFMDRDKEKGTLVKEELEKLYDVRIFFFHGDSNSEEDRELFEGAVQEMFGGPDYIICNG